MGSARRIPAEKANGANELGDTFAQNLGVKSVVKELEQGKRDPKTLTPRERGLILLLGRDGKSQVALSKLLKVSRRTVQVDIEKLHRAVAEAADIDVLIGSMILAAEELSAEARARGDVATAWKIITDRVRLLDDLGASKKDERTSAIEWLTQSHERARRILAEPMDDAICGVVSDPRRAKLPALPTVPPRKVEVSTTSKIEDEPPKDEDEPSEIEREVTLRPAQAPRPDRWV
jgi:hypothetical protein